MMPTRTTRLLTAFLLALAPALVRAQATSSPPANPRSTSFDRDLALASFDTTWEKVRVNHYDSTFGGLDWNAVRRELRPRAEAAADAAQLRAVLTEMIGRLGVSHYTLIPAEYYQSFDPARKRANGAGGDPADAGLSLRVADSVVIAWRVASAGPAARAGIRAGDVVTAIDDYRPDRGLRTVRSRPGARERQLALTRFLYAINRLVEGEAGDTVRITVRAGGRERTRVVPLARSEGLLVRMGNLPPTMARLRSQRLPVSGGCVGVIAWNTWMAPLAARIDAAVDSLRDCRGIVLDLRGNPGGVAGMVMGIGGHFVDSVQTLGTLKMRSSELRFVTNPRRTNAAGQRVAVHAGPLAILQDEMSASTSEVFAGGMQAIGRARVFGEVSAGQALPALMDRLPNGDVLLHAVADYIVVDGSRPEGRGVIPDEVVPLTRAAAAAGRDAPLDAALRWMAGTKR